MSLNKNINNGLFVAFFWRSSDLCSNDERPSHFSLKESVVGNEAHTRLPAVWPDMAKFPHFGEILKVFFKCFGFISYLAKA